MNKAILYSSAEPDQNQRERFLEFLRDKYGEAFELIWTQEQVEGNGFRLVVGSEVYDWSMQGRLDQFREALEHVRSEGKLIPLLKETVHNWVPQALAEEIGTVESVGDGIATVSGLENAVYGEILMFAGGVRGMVMELQEDFLGCILFNKDDIVTAGSRVSRTKRTTAVPVGEGFLGRVVNALGVPVDGKGQIREDGYRPIEHPAPSIIDRQPVNRPMETGILAIDSMFPIGRGQRELIIGDRQTGKTAIAVDTILNQKGKDVICIYVAIGQKESSVAQLAENLKKRGGMDHTIIVEAGASESDPMLYLAPYSATAMGEYFMEKGKDVLIVYDDLSKHAVAYRAISLLLDRSPGREAFPGDVFYLHSRLLERSAHLSDERGGGSMTALPIAETQNSDISAYIPTNIISITDGQLFLEDDLFFAGQRPAVNVGLSVSRVGGDAQTKAMKKSAGALRLDLAQYREMEVFTQFASDLDETTKRQLLYGQGLMRMLRQKQYQPMSQHQQVTVLCAALAHCMQNIPEKQIEAYVTSLITRMEQGHRALCDKIDREGILSDENREQILEEAKKLEEEMLNGTAPSGQDRDIRKELFTTDAIVGFHAAGAQREKEV